MDRIKIVYRKVTELIEAEYNPRKINPEQFEQIKASLLRFDCIDPIIINTHPDRMNVIIGGHQRVKVARELEIQELPCVELNLTPERERELNIRLNRNTGEWDWDLLNQHFNFSELSDWGFTEDELNFSFDDTVSEGLTDPDAIPEPPDEAITKRGDIWLLGNHRLMCGDSGSPEDLAKLLDGAVIQLVNTDPPYNVAVEPRSNNAIAVGVAQNSLLPTQRRDLHLENKPATTKKLRPKDRPLKNDHVTDEEFDHLLDAWFGSIHSALMPGGVFYIWGGFGNIENYMPALRRLDLKFAHAIIWVKNQATLGRKDFMCGHEWCFYGWKKGAGHRWLGPNNVKDVWEVTKVHNRDMVHLTEKPVELAVRAIQYSSLPGENVLDLFGGSGSTLIACQMTDRHGFSMELDELYCDVIVKRWEEFTGDQAVLVRSE